MNGKTQTHFPLLNFRWLLLVNLICVCGAVMSFGLVAFLFLDMREDAALSMIYMIPPMCAAVGVSTHVTLNAVRRRMETLLNGIQRVAGGDLDVELSVKGAGEYAPIYSGFNRMVRELKATKQQMQSFVNEFAHEFKTPITSICGFAQYLLAADGGAESAERRQYLQVIHDEAMRLSSLSQNTLLLSKVEACQIITEKQDFSLSEQVKRCAILLLPQCEQKGVALNADLPDITYRGNAEMLEQVWVNLIGNAAKFTPAGGAVTLRGSETDREVCIEVADTGIGMDADTIGHIFEKYYQNDTVSAVQGNGIGLSIVSRIVTLCGGSIAVQSEPGQGSTFAVHLPK